jgi:hypothetical protein
MEFYELHSTLFFYFKKLGGQKMRKKCETLENKMVAFVLVCVGAVSVIIEGDATAFVFLTMIGIVLFFSKENVVG